MKTLNAIAAALVTHVKNQLIPAAPKLVPVKALITLDSPYHEGIYQGMKGENNCPYSPNTSSYREFYRGHFDATADGEKA